MRGSEAARGWRTGRCGFSLAAIWRAYWQAAFSVRGLLCQARSRGSRPEVPGVEVAMQANNALQLTIALAPAPRDTEEGHSACSPFGEHRTLAAYPRCSTDILPWLGDDNV